MLTQDGNRRVGMTQGHSGRGSESALFGLHKACENRRPVRVRFRGEGYSVREAASRPGSSSLGLKRSQAHMWTAPSLQGVCSALIRSLASICPACECART